MDQLATMAPLLFGAAIIIYFAHDRFRLGNLETETSLERLHHLLSVDRMRTTSVVRLALVFYTVGLLTIYFLMTAYVYIFPKSIPDLSSTTQGVVGGTLPGAEQVLKGSAAVPLGVALVIVGIGPSFPYLKNIEIWLRGAAHRLAGIPTKVLGHADTLRARGPLLNEKQRDRLLPRADDETIRAVERICAMGHPELGSDLLLISAATEAVLRRHLQASDPRIRRQFLKIETLLLDRKAVLFRRIRLMVAGEAPSTPTQPEPDPAEATPESGPADSGNQMPPRDWDSLATEADHLADDICLLLALYCEHGIIRPMLRVTAGSRNDGKDTTNSPDTAKEEDQKSSTFAGTVREWLEGLVIDHAPDSDPGARAAEMALLALSWTLGIAVVATIAWSAFPGAYEYQITHPDNPERGATDLIARILSQFGMVLPAYIVPVAVAIGIWQGARASNSWGAGLQDHWTRALPRAALLFVCGWLVGTFLICGINLWGGYFREGWDVQADMLWASMKFSFGYNAPTVLRGCFLAVLVVECLDWHWTRDPQSSRFASRRRAWSSLGRASFAALIVGVAALLTRWLTILFVMRLPLSQRTTLDAYDRGLIAYATIFSALITFAMIFCLTEVLKMHKKQPAPDKSTTREAAPGNAAITVPLTAAIIWMSSAAAALSDNETITIGVREDARPYIWWDESSGAYRGYLWDLCTSLAHRAGLDVQAVRMDAKARKALLEGGAGGIDLLCDPTTITLPRVKKLDELAANQSWRLSFSPIYHIANSSYLQRISTKAVDSEQAKKLKCPPPTDVKEDVSWIRFRLPRPPSDPQKSPEAQDKDPKQDKLWGAITGTTSAERLRDELGGDPKDEVSDCGPFLSDHARAAELFCAGILTRYYGDEELIKAAVEAWSETCQYQFAPPSARRYEPYALLISTRRIPDLDHRITTALYSMATDCSLEQTLRSNFHNATISFVQQMMLNIIKLPSGPPECPAMARMRAGRPPPPTKD